MKEESGWTKPRRTTRGKEVMVLGQQVNEDVFKKMNYADRRQFCLQMDQELRAFVSNPEQYAVFSTSRQEYRVTPLNPERRFLLYSIGKLYALNYIVRVVASP